MFDFETGKCIFKDNPTLVHQAKAGTQVNGKVGSKSYWLLPLTTRTAALHTPVHRASLRPEEIKAFDHASGMNTYCLLYTSPSPRD